MSENPKLVIFDCDGTLIDSQHIIFAAMNHTYSAHNIEPPKREETLRVVGLSLVEAIKALSPEFDLGMCERFAQTYKNSFSEFRSDSHLTEPMFDGARDILHRLKNQQNIQLGIATGKSRRGVAKFLERENLEGYFDTVQTADDAPSKPSPVMLEQALLEIGLGPDDAIMIGDTTFDIEMAVNAGVKPIGVSWGYHGSDELSQAGAHHVIDEFTQLKNHL